MRRLLAWLRAVLLAPMQLGGAAGATAMQGARRSRTFLLDYHDVNTTPSSVAAYQNPREG